MKNDTIDSAELLKRLKALGVDHDISSDKLQRWAKHGVIPPYTSYYQHRSKRPRGRPLDPRGKTAKAREEKGRELEEKRPPGHYSAWPRESLIEIAAVWAVHHSGIVKRKTLTREKILLDGMDSRKKVMYAPFIDYDPLKKYDPFENPTKLKQRIDGTLKKINESRLQPPGVDPEKAAMHVVPLQLSTYSALVGCHIVHDALVAFREGIKDYDEREQNWLYQKARVFLDALDSLELSLSANMPFVREVRGHDHTLP